MSPKSLKKRVAVIGGGFAGICMVKSLKAESIEPVCFEKTPYFGGTWRYHEEVKEGSPSIMWSTVINHSKEIGAASDFLPRKEYPNYMRHFEIYEMFCEYAETFDVLRHIHFNRKVIRVKKAETYEASGQWMVTVKNELTGELTHEVFDGVAICIGYFSHPKMPDFPGMQSFQGQIIHTHSLKKVDVFTGQRVVVIGTGCSGLDAAAEISNVSKQVYLSTRSGAWVFPRVGPYGLPTDYALTRRYYSFMETVFPINWLSAYLEREVLNKKFNHNLYNLKPKWHALCKEPSVNDHIAGKIVTGAVVVRKNIDHFTEKGVVFQGEEEVTEVDSVIMATGYDWKFPFLDDDVVKAEKNGKINLYKCMYPPQFPHPTLCVIGFLLPFGSGFPLGEMQCRWASHLLSGKGTLPSKEEMIADIDAHYKENVKRYAPSDKMSLRTSFIPYLDDIASQFGVKPNLFKMAFRDPKLFRACVFGPCLPYQYRLEGPHSWPGARDAILTAYSRMRYPLSGENSKKGRQLPGIFVFKYLLALLTISIFLSWKDSSVKYYLVAMFLPYFLTWKSTITKFFFILFMLPFFVTWQGFTTHYFLIVFVPLILTAVTSI